MPSKRIPVERLPIKRSSPSHDVLLLAASRRNAGDVLTVDTVIHVLGRCRSPKKVHDAAGHLVKHDLLAEVGSGEWSITQHGESVLSEIARRNTKFYY